MGDAAGELAEGLHLLELAQLIFPFMQRRFRLLALGDVTEDQNDTKIRTRGVSDGRCAIVYRSLFTVLGDQDGVIRQANRQAVPQDFGDRIVDRLTIQFVDNDKDIR